MNGLAQLRHLHDGLLASPDGRFAKTIALSGLHFETADTDELNYRLGLRDAMLRALGNSRFAIYRHVIRQVARLVARRNIP